MAKKIIITEAQIRRIINETDYGMAEVGEIECTLNFDEDWYEEYLADNNLADTPQNKQEYIRQECDYDIELFDAQEYKHYAFETMTLDKIEENFGSKIANDVFLECMDGKSHRYELQAYDDESVDLNNPRALSDAAMKRLKSGPYEKGCRGFILPNGVVVYTESEHNLCSQIPGVKGKFHFIELGCIRVLDHSVDLAKAPTAEQRRTLQQLFDLHYGEELSLDLMNKEIGIAAKKYSELYPEDAFRDIDNYFNYGIKPRQEYELYESIFEGKKSSFKKWIKLNESIGKPLTLYHGSFSDFDHFDLKYVLTGVGQADYGYGIYLSDNPETAREYSAGHYVYTAKITGNKFLDSEVISPVEARKIARDFYNYYLQTDYGKEAYAGHENEFWDMECQYIEKADNGVQVYNTISSILGSDKDASEYLNSKGYVGLRILSDNGITGEKFHNYMIFDPRNINIVKKEAL